MAALFRIDVNTMAEILSSPPPEFRHLNLIYAPFGVQVGGRDYPGSVWCDFAGLWLFLWSRAVWKLSSGQDRAVRLPFWYTYEMWLRQTKLHWWRLSLVERYPDSKRVVAETLLIPEMVESALLTAIQKLLAAAKHAGVWTEDCAALDALLHGRESYLEGLEAGTIRPPAFLSENFAIPISPGREARQFAREPPAPDGPYLPRSDVGLPRVLRCRMNPPPILCPRCGATLRPWGEEERQQVCGMCGERTALE